MDLAKFDQMPENVAAYVRDSRSENTKRAYRSDWAAFAAYCKQQALEPLPAEPMTVAAFIAGLPEFSKASTIARKVASISSAHKMAGLPSPCQSEIVLSTLKGIRRSLTVAPRKVSPVRVAHLRTCFQSPETSPTALRDRALVLLGYAGGFRRSELVALDFVDVERTMDGFIVTVRRSKTDQSGAGHRKGIPYGSNADTCPVRALAAWLEKVGESTGPIFRPISKSGRILTGRLTDKSVSLIVKKLAPAMGIDPAKASGHSMRAGFVTDAYAAGAPEAAIMATTGHRSHAVMSGYRREANLFRQNAASMVGL